jgi:hypothetical protein
VTSTSISDENSSEEDEHFTTAAAYPEYNSEGNEPPDLMGESDAE